jgi:Family of unknown function (DUF5947)
MMPDPAAPGDLSTLKRFARRGQQAAQASLESCEFCGEPIPSEHRHLLEVSKREVMCVCQACSILFDREAASLGKFRLIPDRRIYFPDFRMDDMQWESLRIPVGLAFFFYSTPAEKILAYYPGPMGATESLLSLDTWDALVESNPVLKEMEPDVEALLINRARGAKDYFLVPVDECYRLVGLLHMNWRGFTGGKEVWEEIGRFFKQLQARSKTFQSVTNDNRPSEDEGKEG